MADKKKFRLTVNLRDALARNPRLRLTGITNYRYRSSSSSSSSGGGTSGGGGGGTGTGISLVVEGDGNAFTNAELSSDGLTLSLGKGLTFATVDDVVEWLTTLTELLNGRFIRKDMDDGTEYSLTIGGTLTVGSDTRIKGELYVDTAIISEGLITAIKGVQFGLDYVPGILGKGGYIDGDGYGELGGLTLREWLEVPELRYNRVSVYTGVNWITFGAGIIESVEIDMDGDTELQSGVITLKLEDGEIGAVAVGDLCQGIFHEYDDTEANDDYSEDQHNGNFHFAGFGTAYFRVEEILEESDNSKFRYVLRTPNANWGQQHHPREFMHFACYANPENKDRQRCIYFTTDYLIGLRNMTDWEYGSDNIHTIIGLLDGFTYAGRKFSEGETGSVFGNTYIYGTIQQVTNAPYVLDIAVEGDDYLLSEGEQRTVTCTVTKAFETITNDRIAWGITRETGVSSADAEWNAAHTDFDGTIDITYDDILGSDTTVKSALFRITADVRAEDGTLAAQLADSIVLRAYYEPEEDTSPWYMNIDTRGDSFLAYGETLIATCYVYHGWNMVNDYVEKWTVTRDSGDEASDAVWNASDKAKAFDGEIEIGYDDLSLVQLTTYFTMTAEGSEIETTSYTVRFG